MRAAVICNGEIRDYELIKGYIDKGDFIICCDGGLKHCEGLGAVPDLIVGDFDSAKAETLKEYDRLGTKIMKVPCEKDFTDCELGVRAAAERGASEITFLGCTGGRLDHTLAACHTLLIALRLGIKARLADEHSLVYIIDKDCSFKTKKGQIISLIPLTTSAKGVSTEGLYYPLENAELKIGETLGVSNVALAENINIKISEGVVLVIFSKD